MHVLAVSSIALLLYAAIGLPGAVVAASDDLGQRRLGRTAPGEVNALAAGKLLVASRDLRDPNFAESVVLLLDYANDGAAGVIVNVHAAVPLSRVFPDLSLGANAPRPAFAGGPVARSSALALVRTRSGITGARPVAAGVELIATRELLEHTLETDAHPDRFRLYLGRAGWGPGQLDRETVRGDWHVFDAESNLVFDPDPATVWRRLIRRTELLLAGRPGNGPRACSFSA